jgi:hypothetical protein
MRRDWRTGAAAGASPSESEYTTAATPPAMADAISGSLREYLGFLRAALQAVQHQAGMQLTCRLPAGLFMPKLQVREVSTA